MNRIRIRNRIWILASLLCWSFCAFEVGATAEEDPTWVHTYATTCAPSGQVLVQYRDGGLVVGPAAEPESAVDAPWLLRMDASGVPLWRYTYPAPGLVRSAEAGGFVAWGRLPLMNPIGAFWVSRIRDDGSVEWQKSYQDPAGTVPSLLDLADGFLVFTVRPGEAWPAGILRLVRLDLSGNIVWQREFAGPFRHLPHPPRAYRGQGAFFLVGSAGQNASGNLQGTPCAMKLDGDGKVLWQRCYNSQGAVESGAIEAAPARGGGLVIEQQVMATTPGTPASGLLVLRVDGNGNLLWRKAFRGVAAEAGQAPVPMGEACWLLGRMTTAAGRPGLWVASLGAEGQILWQRSYGGAGVEGRAHLLPDSSGGGLLQVDPPSAADLSGRMTLLKLDASGAPVWQHAYGGSVLLGGSVRRGPTGDILLAGNAVSMLTVCAFLAARLDASGQTAEPCSAFVHESDWVQGVGAATAADSPALAADTQVEPVAPPVLAEPGGAVPSASETSWWDLCAGSPPLAAWAIARPPLGSAPLDVQFTGIAEGGAPPYGFTWEFGDGVTAQEQNPSHTYAEAGEYLATLQVTDATDSTASAQVLITVLPPTCLLTCSALVLDGAFVGEAVAFHALALGPGCLDAFAFAWDFGDGSAAEGPDVSHAYSAPGAYAWSLTVTAGTETCRQAGVIVVTEAVGPKPGDCDGDGTVSLGELVRVIGMFLEFLPPGCGADCNADGKISIGELMKAINAFLGKPAAC